jgi:hypothetical protein
VRMPYLTLVDVALPAEHLATRDDFEDSRTEHVYHAAGTVLSDHEVTPFIRAKIAAGDDHYLGLLRPIDDVEAFERRAARTALEGDHSADGGSVGAPWPDYSDLRTHEILARMREADPATTDHAKRFEQARPVTRDEIVTFGQAEDPPALSEISDRTPPSSLRWAGADLRDIKEAHDLERSAGAIEETPRFVLSSPMAGVIGEPSEQSDAEQEGR